jgi:hypothetical protein
MTTESVPEAQHEDAPAALLNPIEARVLGCLMEKKYTTPDNYPLTLNALLQACNQKTSRDPVMKLSVGEVGNAVNRLRDRKLLNAEFSGRTERYQERLSHQLLLDRSLHAIICTLMLRGPQTLGEIRINASRMTEFDDLSAVREAVERLQAKSTPLLQRLSGQREDRYGHLLCGAADEQAGPAAPAVIDPTSASPRQQARIDALETQVATLRAELDRLWQLSGLADQQTPPAAD